MHKQFKSAVSLLNSAEHFEDSLRTYSAEVKHKPVFVSHGDVNCPRRIDPVATIGKYGDIAIEAMKEVNSIIEQVHFKKKGECAIRDMQYSLIEMVNDIYLLSLDDQQKVRELVKQLIK